MNVTSGTAVLAGRNARLALTRRAITTTAIVPAVFFLGFYAALASTLRGRGIDPEQFLPPAVMLQAEMFAAVSTAVFLASERASGMFDRWRSMPIGAASVPLARLTVDSVRQVTSICIVTLLGAAVGFRFDGGPLRALAFFVLALGFGLVLAAGGSWVGLALPNPETVTAVVTLLMLPLLMFSTAIVPATAFPGWLQPIVNASPVTAVVNVMRDLTTGAAAGSWAWKVLAWLVALGCVFGWRASLRFARRHERRG